MKKALFVASVFGFLGAFEKNDIKILQDQGFEIFCASNGSEDLGVFGDIGQLDALNINKCQIDFARSPFSKATVTAYKQLKDLIAENNFGLIHCHTPVGGILTRLAARTTRKKGTKVIYTAHGFHFFKGAPLLNWLLFYPAEKLCAHFTDALITINREDYALAKKKMKAKKIYYIPGVGVNTQKFANIKVDRIQKRKELGVPDDAIMLLSIGELNKNKNHEIIIRALAKLKNPNLHYYIAGKGDLKEYLEELSHSLNIGDKIHLLGYRNDVPELCKAADIFCFPSHREGLGLAAIEAMAAGLPLITSNIHGINDYSINDVSGYSCSPDSTDEFANAIDKLAKNNELREQMGINNMKISGNFDVGLTNGKMKKIYDEVIK